jgi:hypothetical protein
MTFMARIAPSGLRVGTVACAHGDGEGIDLRFGNKFHRLVRIGQKLVMGELALETMAVFLLAFAAFERTQHAQLAFHRNAAQMGHVGDSLGHGNIVVPVARCLAVGLQRAIHHHRGKPGLDRGHAGGGLVAVIEMHADGDMRIDFCHCVHHVLQHDIVGIGARAARSLDDHRRVRLAGRLHDGQGLLHVVDVEGRHAVIVLGCVVQKLAKGDAGHKGRLLKSDRGKACCWLA